MPKKKRHHYIPRFYLKQFSVNNEGKFIGLFNLMNNKFVDSAPLRHQGYKNFLYGQDDDIENALAILEGTVAEFFYYWTEEKQLLPPPPETNGFKVLKQFILYQAFRVPKSGLSITDTLNESIKVLFKEIDPELSDKLKGYKIIYENPVLLSLLHSIEYEHYLNFLDCKFLVNLSPLPFITSDAPVIFYNQLMEKAGTYTGSTGLVAKGLQIFYPIHPRLMICLFDSKVYDFGDGCENCFGTESWIDIHQLNGLQFINSDKQVFFDNTITEEYVRNLSKDFSDYRGSKKHINEVVNFGSRKFFLTSSEDEHIDLKLDFFDLVVNPEDYKGQLTPLRHPSLKRDSEQKF
ncbi:DUF4238 domain-containing protein [Ekhidna sp.]|uniref:DUF4238 domain-containing protein n=1 Tax=Ekhidna sp. TaxID=2608089 RepID=UPI003CCBBF5F